MLYQMNEVTVSCHSELQYYTVVHFENKILLEYILREIAVQTDFE